ncbi:hypothetical protein [Phenylobacterium sp.]|jgi:hypothetical protein|uniref:hypothetical protein n=1 Tax=Phenylobacterium sp. TaxID=1871053 RepID=UPI002F41A35E
MAAATATATASGRLHDRPILRPLSEPLHLAVAELAELAALSERLQHAIARVTEARGAPDADFLTEAQAADLLSQRLAGLAAFLRVIAATAPQGVTTDVHAAVMGLTLAEQARRLGGLPPGAADTAAAEAPDSGELQLFEA